MIDFPSQLELIGRIFVAMVLGGIIGFEREVNDHPAGVRTHIMVSVGSALFGIVSAYGFEEFSVERSVTNYQVDVTRVASNVVTGVGFLGGGAILKSGATVRGLTTAASLWATAAIGLGVGLGSYVLCVVATAVVVVSLVALRWPRRWIASRRMRSRDTVTLRLAQGADASGVIAAVSGLPGVTVRSIVVRSSEGQCLVEADLEGEAGTELEALVSPLGDRSDVEVLDVN